MYVAELPPEMDIVLANSGLGVYHKEGVKELLCRVLPEVQHSPDDFFESQKKVAHFLQSSLPLLKWDINEERGMISVVLLCKYRLGAANFFYHMLSRWLIPYQQIPIEVFFTADFSIPQIDKDVLTIGEITLRANNETEWEEMKSGIQALDTEIRLGVISSYHANRILEFKGLATDRKTTMIQEKIGSLIRDRDFDKSIFSQMQRFLVNCREEFKTVRDYHHISRIISIFHLVRKMIAEKTQLFPGGKHLVVKFLKAKLKKDQKVRRVLGITLGLNFLQENERLTEEDVLRIVKRYLPTAKGVEYSFFTDQCTESPTQIIYLEIEKKSGEDFTYDEVQLLRSTIPDCFKESAPLANHPIFMPRNEEEVLRSIATLSQQLKYVKDIPQVIIRFEKQQNGMLSFTVVLLRILKKESQEITKLFAELPSGWQFEIECVKKTGVLRRKYTKQAAVLKILLPAKSYLRVDRSVDLTLSRKDVLRFLIQSLGEVRDYNGGIIHKETELLEKFKQSFDRLDPSHELLLEKFFYSITPAQKRCMVPLQPLKKAFLLFLQLWKKENNETLFQEAEHFACAFFSSTHPVMQKKILDEIDQLPLSSHEKIIIQLDHLIGCIILSEDKILQKRSLDRLEKSFPF
jgi:hypothetical protein